MEKILVPTDFSLSAENAACYAMEFAKVIKANVILCNAIKVPSEAPMAAQVVWPLVDYATAKADSIKDLILLTDKLTRKNEDEYEDFHLKKTFEPKVDHISQNGSVKEVVSSLMDQKKLTMVVMGMSGASNVNHFLLGSNSKEMIESAVTPILLIPSGFIYRPIQKIAIATDLSEKDINVIHSLAGLARDHCAELLIAHITREEFDHKGNQAKIYAFLNEVACKINYHKIYYRHVKNDSIDHGLDWLAEHVQLDMLAMVHRKHDWITSIFQGSYTQKIAKHIQIPLLVFPDGYQPFTF